MNGWQHRQSLTKYMQVQSEVKHEIKFTVRLSPNYSMHFSNNFIKLAWFLSCIHLMVIMLFNGAIRAACAHIVHKIYATAFPSSIKRENLYIPNKLPSQILPFSSLDLEEGARLDISGQNRR